ncbi:300 kDa antigen AG231-like [Colletes gigas]|uniref:300 kDa antigen AG231-like n=1 Tax=Colletes gigas TaxID=935657 RepID=UPI001C9AAEA0|nr:300 kDa antigen AG231-like [Colletes gigas]XP_043256808.1 300 kDa antigen AG231-like [Colletes gigas]
MKTAEALESVKIPETVSDLHKIQKKTRRGGRRGRIRRLERMSREASQQPLVIQEPTTIQENAILRVEPSQTITNSPSELTKALETAETLEPVKIPETVSDLHKIQKKTRRGGQRGRIRRLERMSREASQQPLVIQEPPTIQEPTTIQENAILRVEPSQTITNSPSELTKALETAETLESVKVLKTVSDFFKVTKKTRRRCRRKRVRRLKRISLEASQQPLEVQQPPTIQEIAVVHPGPSQTVAKDPSGLTKALKFVKTLEIVLELNKLPAHDPSGSCVDNIFSGVPTLSVTEA